MINAKQGDVCSIWLGVLASCFSTSAPAGCSSKPSKEGLLVLVLSVSSPGQAGVFPKVFPKDTWSVAQVLPPAPLLS